MYCKYCGKEIADDSRFCNYCGSEQELNEIKEALQRTIDSVSNYGWDESIAKTKVRYPKVDAVKFRVHFRTNTYDCRKDYNDFFCFDSEKDMKDAVICYVTNILENLRETIINDYDLEVYVSTDAFFSKDHDENECLFDEWDVTQSNIYNDTDGNSWVSIDCLCWLLGANTPIEGFWNSLQLGEEPIAPLYER